MSNLQNKFIGARLREARTARALFGNVLAQLVGVSPSAISKYENGTHVPPPNVIAKLSEVLQVPAHYFTDNESRDTESAPLFWRSRSAATKSSRESANQRYDWLRRITKLIDGYIESPPLRFPDFSFSTDPTAITQDDIELAATKLRRFWGLADGPIDNTVRLAENNGGVIVRSVMGDNRLDAFSDWRLEELGHFYIVLASDKMSAVRSRHDHAHEIGHGVMHRFVAERTAKRPEIHKLMEKQAGQFASAFLMPETTFPAEVYSASLDGLLHLKRRWRVSVASMIMRLHDLGVISDDHKRRLFVQVSRRWGKTREPLDDELEPEKPVFLSRAIDMLLDGGVITKEQLVLSTHVSLQETESLLGLDRGRLVGQQDEPDDLTPLRFADYLRGSG